MEPVFQPFCADMYLNTVFSQYIQKFEELGMKLHLDIQLGEGEFPYRELCRILSSGLENAWEASAELPANEREASVQLKSSRDFLLIRMKNRCRRDMSIERGAVPENGKKEPGRGLGIAAIQEEAAALGGGVSAYTSSGSYVLDVMVRM